MIGRLVLSAVAVTAVVATVGPLARANEAKDCTMTAIDRSICVYEAILADIRATYPMEAPGGITALTQKSTTVFEATIGREETSDIWTYDMDFGADGSVAIKGRTERTE